MSHKAFSMYNASTASIFMIELLLKSQDDLQILAQRVLQGVEEKREEKETATVLALHGDLGAGKTTFTQTLARILGVSEHVTSPTFVIMRLYPIPQHKWWSKIVHIDAYRIESLDEIGVIGFADLLKDPTNLICIEWADRIKNALPQDALHITFSQSDIPEDGAPRRAMYGYRDEV